MPLDLQGDAHRVLRHFGEEATVYPPGSAVGRPIICNIDRTPPEPSPGSDATKHRALIDFKNTNQSKEDDPQGVGGISSAEYDAGAGWEIEFPMRIGAEAKRHRITGQPLTQDAGMMRLGVR